MLYSLPVIEWFSVFINSFWIIGLAALLAAFSYHRWLADREHRRIKEQLNQPAFQRVFWISVTLIGVSLAGTSLKTWETAVWIILTLISAVNFIISWR